MAIISDIGGTSQSSFSINGKTTLFQGDDLPNPLMGNNGDVYFKSEGLLYIKRNNVWEEWTKDSVPDARSYQNRLLYSNGENYDFAEVTYNDGGNKELKLLNNLPNNPDEMDVPNIKWIEDRLTYKKIKDATIGNGTQANFTENFLDKDNNIVGSEKIEINKVNGQSTYSVKTISENGYEAKLEVVANDDGSTYLTGTTPPNGITGNIIPTIEWLSANTGTYKLGQLVWSNIEINDVGLKLLNGQRITKIGYEDFWYHLKRKYDSGRFNYIHYENNNNTSITRTESQKGHYFINNSYIWIPNYTNIVSLSPTSNESEIGEHKEAGVPNITGEIAPKIYGDIPLGLDMNGCFVGSDIGSYSSPDGGGDRGGSSKPRVAIFSASNSNPIYGNSDTVQTEAIKVFVYVCVSTNVIGDASPTNINNLTNKITEVDNKVTEVDNKIISGDNWIKDTKSGFIIQWGTFASNNYQRHTVTLFTPFSNTDYVVVATQQRTETNNFEANWHVLSKATTSFSIQGQSSIMNWLAIGK